MKYLSTIVESFSLSASPKQDIKTSLILAILAFLIFLPLKSVFTPNDHQGYTDMVEETQRGSFDASEAEGKLAVALVYSTMSSVVDYTVITISAFLFFLFIVARHSENLYTLGIFLVLLTPISPYFWFITKEALIFLIFDISYIVYFILNKKRVAIFTYIFLITLFGIFIRNYYIILLLGALVTSTKMDFRIKMIVLASGIVGIGMTDGVVEYVYNAKYEMWARLYYYSDVNTLFEMNFVNNPNIFDLVYVALSNYLQILYTPIKFLDHRGIIVLVTLLCYFIAFKKILAKKLTLISSFFVLLFFFLAFMVPDSGTFIRHVSAAVSVFMAAYLYREKNEHL